MSEWQDISTVPKDGTNFQGWLLTQDGSGFWEPHCRFDEYGRLGIYGTIDYYVEGWDYGLTHLTLHRWMPPPAPPQD